MATHTDCIHSSGEEDLGSLLERLRPRFRSILSHFRIPEQDAEDLVQDVVLSLVCRNPENPEAWVISGLNYRCLMYWRSRRRCLYRAVDETILELLAEPEPSEAGRFQVAHDVGKLLHEISSRCRSLLRMRFSLGMRPPELARELGYRRSSIATVTRRCLDALSKKLIGVGY